MKVYSCYDSSGEAMEAVYVGRPTVWGNPYKMHGEKDRDRVCDAFELYAVRRLEREPNWLKPLRGKSLSCHCAPRRCHADTLLRLANADQDL